MHISFYGKFNFLPPSYTLYHTIEEQIIKLEQVTERINYHTFPGFVEQTGTSLQNYIVIEVNDLYFVFFLSSF